MYPTTHTIRLQDGSLLNLKRRIRKHHATLLTALNQVTDGRSCQGKRHNLAAMLLSLFCAMTAKQETIEDCQLWATANHQWLRRYVALPHGIPHPTTIGRALQVVDIDTLVAAITVWQKVVCKQGLTAASLDGKTCRGVHGDGVVKHMLSLLTHDSHQILGQVGVDQKENEIPASLRLFDQVDQDLLVDVPLIADALHTQTDTVAAIRKHHAHYLLFVKGNQPQLYDALNLAFTDPTLPTGTATYRDDTRGRHVKTTVTVSYDPNLVAYLAPTWSDLATVGMIHRTGTRTGKGGTTQVDETVYLIASIPKLPASKAAALIRGHWQIENNLHWQKDYTFDEDHQTARIGNTPQVLSLLRSLVIAFVRRVGAASVTRATKNAQLNGWVHHRLLTLAAVV